MEGALLDGVKIGRGCGKREGHSEAAADAAKPRAMTSPTPFTRATNPSRKYVQGICYARASWVYHDR